MNKLWLVLLGIFLVNGCAGSRDYERFYHDTMKGQDTSNLIFATGEPTAFKGTDPETDNMKLVENGYVLLGYSSFTGPQRNESQAIEKAKELKASVVVIYSKYLDTKSGIQPIVLPDIKTSTSSAQSTALGSAVGTGGYASGSATAYGTGTTTTYGIKTLYKTYSIDRFEQGATYWVKRKGLVLGALAIDLPSDLRQKIGSNKGVVVMVVAKDSPAFSADILKGDIIRKINNTEIIDQKNFIQTLAFNANKKVTIRIIRDGKEIVKEIKLNPVPEGVNIPK